MLYYGIMEPAWNGEGRPLWIPNGPLNFGADGRPSTPFGSLLRSAPSWKESSVSARKRLGSPDLPTSGREAENRAGGGSRPSCHDDGCLPASENRKETTMGYVLRLQDDTPQSYILGLLDTVLMVVVAACYAKCSADKHLRARSPARPPDRLSRIPPIKRNSLPKRALSG